MKSKLMFALLSFLLETRQNNVKNNLLLLYTTQIKARTHSNGHDKPFCTNATTIIDNFKNALGDTDNR